MKKKIDQKIDTHWNVFQFPGLTVGASLNLSHLGALMFLKSFIFIACMATLPSFAGGESGGGGDATEVRVNEIRADILKWINDGGAKELKLPKHLSYGDYVSRMSEVLEAKKVVIGFTDDEVNVGGVTKTCRGYIDEKQISNILCNIARFQKTSESDQYKLIHHEYAGLVRVEENDGAASDYEISTQLTDFLTKQMTLKLAVKKNQLVAGADEIYNNFDGSITLIRPYTYFNGKKVLFNGRTVIDADENTPNARRVKFGFKDSDISYQFFTSHQSVICRVAYNMEVVTSEELKDKKGFVKVAPIVSLNKNGKISSYDEKGFAIGTLTCR
ncbi:MAG: hypothetical protein AB7I27_11770 [Bacteriovoracaceae bacterium]